jgi:hypothetical protein
MQQDVTTAPDAIYYLKRSTTLVEAAPCAPAVADHGRATSEDVCYHAAG